MGTPLGGSNRPRAPFSPTAGHYFCPKYRDTARLGVRFDRRGLEPAVETCHDSTDVVHHDQLTNGALARPGSVHLGNRPRMSSEGTIVYGERITPISARLKQRNRPSKGQ